MVPIVLNEFKIYGSRLLKSHLYLCEGDPEAEYMSMNLISQFHLSYESFLSTYMRRLI